MSVRHQPKSVFGFTRNGRSFSPKYTVAVHRGVCARLDASTELVEQRACQFSAGKVFFEDLGDGEALTRGKPPARDLLRVKARTVFGLLTSGHSTIDGRVAMSASCHGSVPRGFDHLDVVDCAAAADALVQLLWAAPAGCARDAPRLAAEAKGHADGP